jgi:hypothetical protein
MQNEKNREARLRSKAKRKGLVLQRSRSRLAESLVYGTYHLVDRYTGNLETYGTQNGFGLNLDDVEIALSDVRWVGDMPSDPGDHTLTFGSSPAPYVVFGQNYFKETPLWTLWYLDTGDNYAAVSHDFFIDRFDEVRIIRAAEAHLKSLKLPAISQTSMIS